MSLEQQVTGRLSSPLSQVTQPDIWGQQPARKQVGSAPAGVQSYSSWLYVKAAEPVDSSGTKLTPARLFGLAESNVSSFGAFWDLWSEPLRGQNLAAVAAAVRLTEKPVSLLTSLFLDEPLRSQNLAALALPTEGSWLPLMSLLEPLRSQNLAAVVRLTEKPLSQWRSLFLDEPLRSHNLAAPALPIEGELLRLVALGHSEEGDAARSKLVSSGQALPLLTAALREFRTRGGERWLDHAASILADMGRAAIPALWALASMDIPEAEYFIAAIANMSIPDAERALIMSRLARNPDPDVKRRLAAHLLDLPEAHAAEVRSVLDSVGPQGLG